MRGSTCLGHSGSIALESTESVIYEAQPVGSSGFHQLHRAPAQTAGDRGRENLEIAGWPLKHGAVCGALNSRLHHLGDALVAQVWAFRPRDLARPLEWLGELSWYEPQIKALLVWVAGNAAESFGESLRVAVFASRADFRAAAQRVPGRIRPFDFGMIAHNACSAKHLDDVSILAAPLNCSKHKCTRL